MYKISAFLILAIFLTVSNLHAQERKSISIIGTTSGKSITATQPSVAAPKTTTPNTKTTATNTTTTNTPKATVNTPVANTTPSVSNKMSVAPSVSTPAISNATASTNTTTLPSFSYAPTDSIMLKIENQQKYIAHTVLAGQAPMTICRFYGITLNDLYYHNAEILNGHLKVGQVLRIPLSNRALRKYTGPDFDHGAHVPVYYTVNVGDNLYKIAKHYFAMPMEAIKLRNNMQDDYVYKDMCLHIGWIPRFGIPDSLQKYMGSAGALGEENFKLKALYEANITELRDVKKQKDFEHKEEGIACWLKGEKFTSNVQLNVLYSGAPKNSIVRLENIMNPNMFVYARVVGALPNTEVTNGTIIMLSENVAHALGGADERLPIVVHSLSSYPKKTVQGLNTTKPTPANPTMATNGQNNKN